MSKIGWKATEKQKEALKKGREIAQKSLISRKKRSEKMMGIKNFNYQRNFSKEHRDKIGKAQIGKRIGQLNNMWKGGITPVSSSIRTSLKYKFWRKTIFERDDYTCVWCGKRGGILHVDHIIPFSKIIEKIKFEYGISEVYEKAMECKLLWDTNNGRTLCVDCHKKTDNYLVKQKYKKYE